MLLPLYPQYSTTTTGSSFKDWERAARRAGITAPTRAVCCYPRDDGFVGDVADLVAEALQAAPSGSDLRILFSAHGLPKKIVDAGDPYQWQVEQSVAAVLEILERRDDLPAFDPVVCYQSRVGPLEWIGPSTEDEIARAGAAGKALVVVPIAFVSEHSETLVELDIEYGELARDKGVESYQRVATVDAGAAFVDGLARLVTDAIDRGVALSSGPGQRLCPGQCVRCALANAG